MSDLRIAIIMSTTRENRFADKPANWILGMASERDGLEAEIVDLRDYPMPFFEDARSPMWGPADNEMARTWGDKLDTFDGFIFVTAEYNHGVPAVLKNAIDYAYPQFVRKPAAFVGYGNVGAARAIQQLRLILLECQMAPLKNAVHINAIEFIGVMRDNKQLGEYSYVVRGANAMLDDMTWWAKALKTAREATNPTA